ncbi:MAG: hypothetical protein KC451_16225 [Amylibacter sp.]|jgi:hypothetical protein|nr:hypothetical protein [Amylibacter sp.]
MSWTVAKPIRVILCALIALLALSGCVIESETALHEAADEVPVQTIMTGQSAAFRSNAGDYIFLRRAQGRMTVILTKFSGAIGADNTFSTALYKMDGLPRSVYVAVRSRDSGHEYLPFHYDKRGVLILAPKTRVKVSDMEEFRAALLNVKGTPLFYERLSVADAGAAYKRYATRKVQKKKAAKAREHEYVNPFRTFDQGIRRMAVGDAVYWLRAASTDVMTVTVTGINISTGYIMVRRETDYVTAKVHHSRLMTVKQASKNGIKHGASSARSAFCLSQPSECEW